MYREPNTPSDQPVVLVVDDDMAERLLIGEVLSQDGLAVEEAGNGVEAISIFERLHPVLVMMDVKMPEMDGFTACSRIKQLPGGIDTTIVMVTGLDDYTSIQQAYDAGATDFITKPINWPILSHRIRYLLRARSAFQALRFSEERLSQAQAIANIGNWDWEIDKDRVRLSHEVYKICGKKSHEPVKGLETVLEWVHPEDRSMVRKAFQDVISNQQPFSIDHRIFSPDGEIQYIHQKAELKKDQDGSPRLMLGTMQDITQRIETENKIRTLAYFDSLTGLPNRTLFTEHANQALHVAKRNKMDLALIYLDLDRFKRINDTLGYTVGDRVLERISDRLKKTIRDSDVIAKVQTDTEEVSLARLGGDEFTILLTGLIETDHTANVAQRLLEHVAMSLAVDERELFLTASIGISSYPTDGDDIDTLMKYADTAMFQAKKNGGNHFQFYTESMNASAMERLEMEAKLQRAIENDELVLHYQPKVESASEKIIGLEALVRWNHPEMGLVPPGQFIPLAEETGLIIPIGEWVLETACKQNHAWQQAGYTPVSIGVNLSALQFGQQDIIPIILRILGSSQMNPHYLELELTESVLMQNIEESIIVLHEMKEIGLELSIDDFGTGYSSLNYLKKLPLDTLKIDRSFVIDITTNKNDAAIAKSIIALGKNLNMKVIAEGVETQEQLSFLRDEGCDQIQGYLISKPMPADEVIQFL